LLKWDGHVPVNDENLADGIRADAEVGVLDVDGERYNYEAGDEVDDGEGDDVDRRHEIVFATCEHTQDKSIAGRSRDTQHGQHVQHRLHSRTIAQQALPLHTVRVLLKVTT